MSSSPTMAQGKSKEQALAANDRSVRRCRSLVDPVFTGSDHGPRVAATPRAHFASRRSPVRSRLAPLKDLVIPIIWIPVQRWSRYRAKATGLLDFKRVMRVSDGSEASGQASKETATGGGHAQDGGGTSWSANAQSRRRHRADKL